MIHSWITINSINTSLDQWIITYFHFLFAQLSYGVWRLGIYSIQVVRTTFMIFLNSWSLTAPVPIHCLQGRKSVAQVSKDTSVSKVFKFRHNWDSNINILMCSGECVYESNGERVKVSLCNPAAVRVKAAESVYGGDGVALHRHRWLSTNTHTRT